MLSIWLLLIISRWLMVRNKAVFCLEVVIYKHLQVWHHNYVINRNEYVIFAFSESTIPYVYSLQFLFKSTHHSWRYERKREWVFFFWTQCILLTIYHSAVRLLRVRSLLLGHRMTAVVFLYFLYSHPTFLNLTKHHILVRTQLMTVWWIPGSY